MSQSDLSKLKPTYACHQLAGEQLVVLIRLQPLPGAGL
jgi:hypothetical protein